MAGDLSLAIQFKGEPVVTSHGGRARSVIAALAGVPEISATILFYGMTLEQFLNDPSCEYIRSQDFREGGTDLINRNEIKIVE
jgi:hypothetical protein